MKPHFRHWFFIGVCSGILPQLSVQAEQSNWQQKVDTLIAQELKSSGIPSLQIAIGQGQKLVFDQAYGLADIEQNVVATTNTKYRIASISKWLTATAMIKLVESGKLALDAPIQDYCPQYPKKQWTITTRQLLTHTSGVRHYADYARELEDARNDEMRDAIKKRQQNSLLGRFTRYTDIHAPLENFKNDKLLFKPGTDWKYTSFGYRILGCVLESAAGQSYASAMEELIFKPAKMHNTVNDDAWDIISNRSAGYRLMADKKLRRANMRDISENLPAGGHLSTARDLVNFALAFNANRLVNNQHRVLMSSPLDKTKQPMFRAPTWRDAIPSKQNYSHGVMQFPQANSINIGHSGRQAGSDSMLVLDPTDNIAIAILANVKGYNGGLKLIRKVQSILANSKDFILD